MILYHTTPISNMASIRASGLLPERAGQGRQAVWLHIQSRMYWAVLHVCHRHRQQPPGVVVLAVKVPRSWLRKHGGGLYYCARRIPPERILRTMGCSEISDSPVKEASEVPNGQAKD